MLPAGTNRTKIWGLTPRERLARIARGAGIGFASGAGGGPMIANLDYVFDPEWMRFIAARPEHVVTLVGVPVLAHSADMDQRLRITLAMKDGVALEQREGLTLIAAEQEQHRLPRLIARLTPESAAALEEASFRAALQSSADPLARHVWPKPALVLARVGVPALWLALGALALGMLAALLFARAAFGAGIAALLGCSFLAATAGGLKRSRAGSSRLGRGSAP